MTKATGARASTSGKQSKVAQFIAAQIELSELSQREIAEICGFPNPNVITMIKQGHSKLPIDRVANMAKALHVDPIRLLKIVLSEYQPGMLEVVDSIVGFGCTENEKAIIELFRDATNDTDPRIKTEADRQAIRNVFAKMA